MSEPRKDPRSAAAPILIAVLAVLAPPLLYVLSIGPAYWMLRNDAISGETFDGIYFPLQYLGSRFPQIADLIHWYCFLWKKPPS